MSYDISLRYADNMDKIIDIGKPLELYGNTYSPENTELWLNLTYNYREKFNYAFGDGGIYNIEELTGRQSIPILSLALTRISSKKLDYSNDPWTPGWGDALKAVRDLFNMALLGLDGVWKIT